MISDSFADFTSAPNVMNCPVPSFQSVPIQTTRLMNVDSVTDSKIVSMAKMKKSKFM